MSSQEGGTTAAKWVVDELAGPAAVGHHARDQFDRLGCRVQLARHRPVDLENRVLGTIFDEIERAGFQPAIEDGFMPVVIIAAAQNMGLFHPDQAMVITEAALFQSLD